uniref:Uncharacterized protein n=1 Tax=Arundo donax TaxID=35708 RepID=A0A0A9CAZ5_ARUDO
MMLAVSHILFMLVYVYWLSKLRKVKGNNFRCADALSLIVYCDPMMLLFSAEENIIWRNL